MTEQLKEMSECATPELECSARAPANQSSPITSISQPQAPPSPTTLALSAARRQAAEFQSQNKAEPTFALTTVAMSLVPPELQESVLDAAIRSVTEMKPADPLERMLVEQLTWCHERVRVLSLSATASAGTDGSLLLHSQCDAAMGTYRRGMMALKQYRAMLPPAPLVAVQQVNNSQAGNVMIATGAAARRKKTKQTN